MSSVLEVNYPRRKLSGCSYLRAIFLGGNCTVGIIQEELAGGQLSLVAIVQWGAIVWGGGNCPVNCLGGNCPGEIVLGGIVRGAIVLGGNYPGGQLSRGNCPVSPKNTSGWLLLTGLLGC